MGINLQDLLASFVLFMIYLRLCTSEEKNYQFFYGKEYIFTSEIIYS